MDKHKIVERLIYFFPVIQMADLLDEREISLLKPEQYMDWILPDTIEFASRTIRYDNIYTHTFRLTDYPMLVGNAWGHQLFNMPGTRVVMKMKPVEQFKAIRRIDRAIDELRGQEGSTGKASRLIELGNHIDKMCIRDRTRAI